MSEPTTLVLGATGTTGRRVAAELARAGHRVRPASRSGAVPFDWHDPATWPAAVEGATGLYLMAPDGVPVDPAFVDLAVRAGVRRVVLLSSAAVEEMGDQRLLGAERAVRGSGAGWTILRPNWFDQDFDEGFLRAGVLAGVVAVPVGGLRQAFVDAGDVAAVAAAALTTDDHAGRVHELHGPEALTFDEAVATVARVSGLRVQFDGSDEGFLDAQRAAGLPVEAAQQALPAFAALRRRGDDVPNGVVAEITGRPPVAFGDYAAAAAARGAWSA
ncbi:NAD(P)H-binding protein [Geodermatophilus marinus]|uniref:NAD(P)H-binding protein n=1 Tax=Geodermatophilus sp. LHW52908 TaxID=2303986 RepID=UPI000E3BF083|nr:NAD(P)H-binding protein [Geodermatophilus sp. LHW52908]RFU20300.1 NmrA family transcriptional regulator [Geodermatophilus sp. LHW52908]